MLWQVWLDSKRWQLRPSDMIGVRNPYVAYCFDQACTYLGTQVEAAMDNVKEGKKSAKQVAGAKENVMRKMLGLEQKFASPTPTRSRSDADRPEPPFQMEQ